jgi:DNA-binding SARP family transcriptional activator
VLGSLRITAGQLEVSSGVRKARELIAYLAACGPGGASTGAVTEALWPGVSPGAGERQRKLAVRKARDLLRRHTGDTAAMWIPLSADRYRLDPALVDADLWQFAAALDAARRAVSDQDRLAAYRQAASLYRGELCEGAGYDWSEPYAEAARRSVLDALIRIAEMVQPADPEQALAALEAAVAHDRYSEDTYLRIMRLQAEAGRPDAARRTYQLMLASLQDLELTGPQPVMNGHTSSRDRR